MVRLGTKFVVHGGGVYREAYYDDAWVLDLHLRPNVAIPRATPGADLGADFAWLRESDQGLELADVFVDVGPEADRKSFAAHRAVLCARSDYFRALLAGGFREASRDVGRVALPDLDAGAFELALAYLYSGRLLLPPPGSAPDEEGGSAPADVALRDAARRGDAEAAAKALARGADLRESGSAPKRGRHSTICIPPNASVQWQPDGLTFHTKKWFLGASFLGAPPISLRTRTAATQTAGSCRSTSRACRARRRRRGFVFRRGLFLRW